MRCSASCWLVVALVAGCSSSPTGSHETSVVDPAASTLEVDRTHAVVGIDTVTITATIVNTRGEPMSGVTVGLAVTGSNNTLVQPPPTDTNGIAIGTLSSTTAELKEITASIDTDPPFGKRGVGFEPAGPASLAFTTQPTLVEMGAPFAPVAVTIYDAYGNRTRASDVVSLALATNPPTATLAGTTAVSAQDGLATFPDLHLDTAGSGYALVATSGVLPAATSAAFDVVQGDPDATTSTLTIAPYVAEADGTSPIFVTATLRNHYNVPIANLPVTMSATGTNNVFSGPATTDASGVLQMRLTTTTAEGKTVTAVAAGIVSLTNYSPVFVAPVCIAQLPAGPWRAFAAQASAFTVADVDGDHQPDAIVAEPSASAIVVSRGRGDGRFLADVTSHVTGAVTALAAGDLDGDGLLDLVLVPSDQSDLLVMHGNGDGSFAAATAVAIAAAADHVVLGDFDGDGKLDVAATVPSLGEIVVHLGHGDDTFGTERVVSLGAAAGGLAAIDVDVDGKLDLVATTASALVAFRGAGDGTFAAAQTTATARAGTLVTADFDRDTTPDVAVAASGGTEVWLGNRDGTFRAGASLAIGATVAVAADLDGDGNADLALSRAHTLTIVPGLGTGAFGAAKPYASAASVGLAAIDTNGDARLDLIAAGSALGVLPGLATGGFAAPALAPRVTGKLYDTSGDFNGDGRLDLVRYDDALGALVPLLTAADGSFVDPTGTPWTIARPTSVAVADLDGDGIADLVAADPARSGLAFALGNGDGTFRPQPDIAVPVPIDSVRIFDLDADGVHDLVMWNSAASSSGIYIAAETAPGTFAAPLALATGHGVSAVDAKSMYEFNQYLDLVVLSATDHTVTIFYGGGNLYYGYKVTVPVPPEVTMLAVFAVYSSATIYLVGGDTLTSIAVSASGVSAPQSAPLDLAPGIQVTTAQLSGADLVLGSSAGMIVRRALNVGLGAPRYYGVGDATTPYVTADRNGDGLADIAFWNGDGASAVLQNACEAYTP